MENRPLVRLCSVTEEQDWTLTLWWQDNIVQHVPMETRPVTSVHRWAVYVSQMLGFQNHARHFHSPAQQLVNVPATSSNQGHILVQKN